MSIATRVGESTTKRVDELETIGAEIVDNMQSLVDRVAGDTLDHTSVRSVFEQLLGLSTQVHTASHLAPAALHGDNSLAQLTGASAPTASAPALTSGSTAPTAGPDDIVLTGTAAAQFNTLMSVTRDRQPESLMNLIFDILGPLAALDVRTQAALVSVISDIATQTPGRKVDVGNGKLESEDKVDKLQTELSDSQSVTQNWANRYGSLDAKVTNGANSGQIAKRLVGIHDLTDLLVAGDAGLDIARDGHVTLAATSAAPAPTPPNDATAAFQDLVEHGEYSGFGQRWTFKAKRGNLQPETVEAMKAINDFVGS